MTIIAIFNLDNVSIDVMLINTICFSVINPLPYHHVTKNRTASHGSTGMDPEALPAAVAVSLHGGTQSPTSDHPSSVPHAKWHIAARATENTPRTVLWGYCCSYPNFGLTSSDRNVPNTKKDL